MRKNLSLSALIMGMIWLLTLPLYASYLVTKSLHLIFVISWFAGLFYLPRIYVNLAQEDHPEVQKRLLLMAHKLFRFMTLLAIPAIIFGLWLTFGSLFDLPFPEFIRSPWMHAKFLLILVILGYHHGCYRILLKFQNQQNKRSHIFYRWYNEVPVVLLTLVVFLVILKPF